MSVDDLILPCISIILVLPLGFTPDRREGRVETNQLIEIPMFYGNYMKIYPCNSEIRLYCRPLFLTGVNNIASVSH